MASPHDAAGGGGGQTFSEVDARLRSLAIFWAWLNLRAMRHLLRFGLLCLCLSAWSQAQAATSPLPIPYLSFEDLVALYPPKRIIGDWNSPKLASMPHQKELIARCLRDMEISRKANPDPLRLGRPLPEGKMILRSINQDTDSRIVLFVFEYDSEMVTDLFVVYYYDPVQDRFILKSHR